METAAGYLICATHRSGSNLLCEALTQSRVAGNPGEFFSQSLEGQYAKGWDAPLDGGLAKYLHRVLARSATRNGIFGAKIMWPQTRGFVERLKAEDGELGGRALPAIFAHFFPNLSYVWMTREDKLGQAISMWRAKQSGQYTSRGSAAEKALLYDFHAIEKLRRRFVDEDQAWRDFFSRHRLSYSTVTHCELDADYLGTATRLLRELRVSIPPDHQFAPRSLKRQADGLSAEWRARFLSDEQTRPAAAAISSSLMLVCLQAANWVADFVAAFSESDFCAAAWLS